MPATNIRSVWTSGDLLFRSASYQPTTPPLLRFGQTDWPLQVKIHARPTSAGSGLEVRTRPTSVTATHGGVDCQLGYRPAGAGLAGYNRAVMGVTRLDSGYTVTGGAGCYFTGLYGQFANNGTLNGAGIFASAIYGNIGDGGTYTSVSHLSTLWLDSHRTVAVSAGETEFIYISNNAAATYKNALYIYAGNAITNLFTIDTASGMVSGATTADYVFTKTRTIKIVVGGATCYLIADEV